MILFIVLPVIIGLIAYLYFGRKKDKAVKNAEILGTESKSNNIFHQVLVQPSSFNLEHDGIIICFEKVNRKKQIVKNGLPEEYSEAMQYQLFGIDPSLKVFDEKGLSDQAKQLVKSTLNDPKPITLTHWFESVDGEKQICYDAYHELENKNYDLPKAAILEYKKIGTLIKSRLESGYYTHLLIGSTGWQNNQFHSLETYNNWIEFIGQAAKQDDSTNHFKPFFLGITWPSEWITPVISVFNKANDADETGMTHINYLLWKEIMPSIAELKVKIPVVTIGHSFGARLLSRTVHSRFMLCGIRDQNEIDLAIDLQGAYPTSRFFNKEGNNGGLYAVDIPVKRHVLTTSKSDKAVKYSFWSTYVGNNESTFKIRENNSISSFGFAHTDSSGYLLNFPLNTRKVTVNADAMINESISKLTGAHGDVRDLEAGRFIWELIKLIEK